MSMAGQSINDRLNAARYSLAGQGLAKSVSKATTEEVIGPKKKHLDYLLQCTNEPNVSIPQLANLIIERSQMQSWVVVFKALISVHHLMCYGNERFTQYLASSNCNFNLGGFLDKSGGASQPQLSYDMSTFIRRYAKYINEKAISYRGVAFDFCKTKRGKDDGTLRAMPTDTLLRTLPILQAQLDALLDFDCNSNELNNGVINSAFMLLFRDLIRLFACYNDGIINLLEKYFEMNKKQARDALDCYKKFLIRMDRVSEFLKVAEAIGMDKSEIPDLKQAPSSLLDALEAHLASLEGKKIISASASAVSGVNLKSAVSALNSTSSSFGLACSNGRIGESGATPNGSPGLDENTRRAALAEEEAMYEKLKQEQSKNNPFLSSPTKDAATTNSSSADTTAAAATGNQILDLFSAPQDSATAASQNSKASDDLLQLGNPFASMMSAPPAAAAPPIQQPPQPYTNGFGSAPRVSSSFVTDNAFDAVFGNAVNNTHKTFDGFGDILKPEGGGVVPPSTAGGPAPPVGVAAQPSATQKLISSDLDMSLSSLVENLNMKGPPAQRPQWSSPKTQTKTGGVGWAQPGAAPPVAGFRQAAPINFQQMGGVQPMTYPQQPMGVAGMQPAVPQQAGAAVGAAFPPGQPSAPAPPAGGAPTQAFDPFGAL